MPLFRPVPLLVVLCFRAVVGAAVAGKSKTDDLPFCTVAGMILLDAVVDGKPASLLLDTCANRKILSARAERPDEFTRLVRDGVPVTDFIGRERN